MPSCDLVINHAHLVTCDDAATQFHGGVAVTDGKIVAVGDNDALKVWVVGAEQVIDAQGALLMPGLINTHCHAGDSLFRGLVENLSLENWLGKVWQAESAILTPATTRLGSQLGFAELLLGGVTTVLDMFWFPWESVAAARELGIRVATGGLFFDPPGVGGRDQARYEQEAEAFFLEFADADDVLPLVMPHGAYTVSPENLQAAHAIAHRHSGLFSTHAAETVAEQADIRNRYGKSVIHHLDSLGLLNEQTVLAHCVHVDASEIECLAERKVTVAHNPMSNLKLASGIAPIPAMQDHGVRIALGTDGAISGNDLDMFMAMRLAATVHKGASQRPDVVSAVEAVTMATRGGALALNQASTLGSIEVGKFADMILIDCTRPNAIPMFDGPTHLAFSAQSNNVRDVFVGGRQIVKDGSLQTIDLADISAKVEELRPKIAASIA